MSQKKIVVIMGFILFCMWGMPHEGFSKPASKAIHVLKQSDGFSFEARQWGDEYYSGWETVEGYTVIFDEYLKKWAYAKNDSSGNLVSSGLIVGTSIPPWFSKNLKPKSDALTKISRKRRSIRDTTVSRREVTGTHNILVILVNFTDTTPKYTRQNYEDLFFKAGNSSLADYFSEVSLGKFSVSSGPSGVQDWWTAPDALSYYGNPPAGRGSDEKDNEGNIDQLVRDAVTALDNKGFDFAPYDNNKDGYVDTVAIICRGFEESDSGVTSDIWPTQSELTDEYVSKTPNPAGGFIKIRKHIRQGDMKWEQGVLPENAKITGIGTFAHEYGHALDLPDLYDTDYSSQGIGLWSLMSSGTDLGDDPVKPGHLDAWCKFRLGWVTPISVTGVLSNQSIPPVERFDQNAGGVVYQLLSGTPGSGEYFLVENRQKVGFDTGLPKAGLLIWHIDGNKITALFAQNKINDTGCVPPASCAVEHYGVTLVQADGIWDLEKKANIGDEKDPFPGDSNNTSFTDSTTPNSKLWNGTSSGVSVTDISISGNNIIATLSGPQSQTKGDINAADGVDLKDVVLALQVVCGLMPSGVRADYAASGVDVNGDNRIGLEEAVFDLQVVAGVRY